jgi:FkbM family methyltransferase
VLDAGANIGCFTVPAAIRVGPKGLVVAVEPDHDNIMALRQNLTENSLSNVALYDRAVYGRSSRSVSLVPGGVLARVEEGGSTIVETVTLSELISWTDSPKFDVIKVDIEGSELAMLDSPGASGILGQARAMAIEVHSPEAEVRFKRIFRESGATFSGPRTE